MSIEPQGPRAAVDDLVAAIEPLAYPDRMRALATWTRERVRHLDGAGDDAGTGAGNEEGAGAGRGTGDQLRPLLGELDTRGSYGRRLAVVAAVIGGAVAFLEARLADPDATVRKQALKASLRLPIGDTALERAMDDAPQAVRRQLATCVVTGGRTALAERLLLSVRELWGDEEAARLLPGCGPEAVERLLPALFRAVVRWRALCRRHPDLVLDEAARQLADLPEQARANWWSRNGDLIEEAAAVRPGRVLDLLEQHCPTRLPRRVRDSFGPLLRADPGRAIRLLTAPERLPVVDRVLVSRTALSRLARLAPAELTGLGRAWGHHPDSLVLLLGVLPPARREAFYDAATAGQNLGRATLGTDLLDVLPRRRAQSEARRMAEQATERGEPWSAVLATVAHLPVEEARDRLLAATRRAVAADRALAYPLLIRNVARSGTAVAVGTLLEDLQRLRNEQEPVRSPALAALAEVPPGLFTGADTNLLERIATDSLEARDSSHRSRQSLSALALALLREHAVSGEQALLTWALTTVTRLSGHTGGANLGELDRTLRRGQEFQVLAALRPWLEAGADKVDHSLTFALARALGRRARHLPELQELLWQAIQFGDNATMSRAVDLWLDDPSTRDERALRVLELEPSAAVLPPVLRVLTHRRTDLLHTVLADTPPYGRFLVEGARWLPPTDGIGRWVPAQQAAAARLLTRAVNDASLPKHDRARHLRTAAAIPELGPGIVRRYLDSPDTVLAEAALGALAWTDRPADALPTLLAHAADDRARVALYTATRASRYVAPSRLDAVLRGALLPAHDGESAPAAKVTSRKELVRLAASRLPVGRAAVLLEAAFDLPGQHPDVQAACVPVAVELLRSPAAWRLLERAADGPPVTQAGVLRVRPHDLARADRPRYARLVGRVSRSADAETADAAMGPLGRWSPWYPEAAGLLLAAAVDLDNRSSWRPAADGLVAMAAAAADGAGPLLEALAHLVAAETEAPGHPLDAAEERDRPARRRIGHLVTRLSTSVVAGDGKAARTAALRAAELLCATDDFLPRGTHLFARTLDLAAEPAQLITDLERLADLHTDRPAPAVRTAEALRTRLGTARRPGDPAALLLAAERLTANTGYAAGHFAVALTQALGARTGWPPAWRDLLRTLRCHPQADVRDAALELATAAE